MKMTDGNAQFFVFSEPKKGMEREFNEFYTETHIPEICGIDGIQSGQRYEAVAGTGFTPVRKYLAVYNWDSSDIAGTEARLLENLKSGRVAANPYLDPESVWAWMYQPLAR